LLAIRFGPKILKVVETPIFEAVMAGVIAVSLVASVWIILSWRRKSK